MVSADVRVARARVVFKGPGPQVNGLEAVPEGLWVSDQQDNRTYLVDYNGKVLTSFASPARNASGTSAGAGSVWVASNVRPSAVYRHDPQSGHCTAALLLPNAEQGGVHGLQWRPYELGVQPPAPPEKRSELHPTAPAGKLNAGPGASGTLWVTRPGAKVIDHIDAETGEALGQVPFPAPRSHGLYWDEADNTLNVVETNHGHVYKLDPRSGEVRDEWRIEGPESHALTRSADGRIWVGDAATNEILVVEL
jgi:streptogramin lyase